MVMYFGYMFVVSYGDLFDFFWLFLGLFRSFFDFSYIFKFYLLGFCVCVSCLLVVAQREATCILNFLCYFMDRNVCRRILLHHGHDRSVILVLSCSCCRSCSHCVILSILAVYFLIAFIHLMFLCVLDNRVLRDILVSFGADVCC